VRRSSGGHVAQLPCLAGQQSQTMFEDRAGQCGGGDQFDVQVAWLADDDDPNEADESLLW